MFHRPDLVRVLVGPGQREFVVHRTLLCASSAVFCQCIDSAAAEASSESLPTPPLSSDPILVPWLAAESASMFEIFVLWLYRRHAFRNVINEALTVLMASGEEAELLPERDGTLRKKRRESETARACTDLHWNLVHAHLFAARADIPAFQDAVMDALQDLYLRLDWEATPRLVRFLYVDCPDPVAASRLRKWTVPLLAWTLANGVEEMEAQDEAEAEAEDLADFHLDLDLDCDENLNISNERSLRRLLSCLPDLRAEYDAQLAKLAASGADVRFKNPQLRIPSNHLRREDRLFGFRQCAFHSHRRSVGQGRCPHNPVLVHYHHHHRRGFRGHRRAAHSADESSSARRPVTPPASSSMSMSITMPQSSATSTFSSPTLSSPALSFFPPITTSEPRLIDLPAWSPLSVTTPGLAPLGMELTI